MRPPILYRISSVLMVLFAAGHLFGFRQVDPRWGADAVVAAMRTTRFDVNGFSRTYWDFFLGLGFCLDVFMLFLAVLSWQLAGLTADQLRILTLVNWALAVCFVMVAVVSWYYVALVPVVLASVIALCLGLAAWLSGKPGIPA